jgi:hypothetical protein
MGNKDITNLFDVWNMISKERLGYYHHKGILYLKRDEDGIVQERYFKTFEDFEEEYPKFNREGQSLIVDLSRKTVPN